MCEDFKLKAFAVCDLNKIFKHNGFNNSEVIVNFCLLVQSKFLFLDDKDIIDIL